MANTRRSRERNVAVTHEGRRPAAAARVTFCFEEIFLFVMHKDCVTVLAPAKGHVASLYGPRIGHIQLRNHEITLLKGGVRAKGKFSPNNETHMVNIDSILGKGTYDLRPDLHRDLISARFELGGDQCSLEDRPAKSDDPYKELKWAF